MSRFLGDLEKQRIWGKVRMGPAYSHTAMRSVLGQTETGEPNDLKDIITIKEWINADLTEEKAKTLYSQAVIFLGLREKMAFVASLGKSIAGDLPLYNAVAQNKDGIAFLKAANEISKTLRRYDLPKLVNSFENLQQALETVILPGMGIGVRGYQPLFAGGDLQRIRTDVSSGAFKEIIDFGDLTKTSLPTDVNALELMNRNIKERFQLGIEPFTLAAFLAVLFLASVAFASLAIVVKDEFAPNLSEILDDPNVKRVLDSLDPKSAANFIKDIQDANNFLAQTINVLKWVGIIGGGAVGVGFLIYALNK